jgi:anti-sigma regulatory factor (Ser/Thr protein kinase)
VTEHEHVQVADESGAGEVRRHATALARRLAFDENDVGRAGIVATELATNLVKHGQGGEVLLRVLEGPGGRGLGLLALDRGPGFASAAQVLRDGFSSTGTPGTGLGAIRRLSTVFDAYSVPGGGAAILSTIWPGAVETAGDLVAGGINVPYPGETVSGDAWTVHLTRGRAAVILADGLGHGSAAAEAAALAVSIFRQHVHEAPAHTIERVHDALRPTRGAAVGIAELDRAQGVLRFAGIGNIAGTILNDGASRSVVSHHGTAGHDAKKIQEFCYAWPRGAMLVMHSDGLVSHWTLDRYPGLANHDPTLVAGVLYRDFQRSRDDTSVIVLRDIC